MEEILRKLMDLDKEAEQLDSEVTEFLESRNGKIEGIEDFMKMQSFRVRLKRIETDRELIRQSYNKLKGVLGWKR